MADEGLQNYARLGAVNFFWINPHHALRSLNRLSRFALRAVRLSADLILLVAKLNRWFFDTVRTIFV